MDYLLSDGDKSLLEIRDALKELVDLKELKDKNGKTMDYLKRQPIAWIRAKRILAKYKNFAIKA